MDTQCTHLCQLILHFFDPAVTLTYVWQNVLWLSLEQQNNSCINCPDKMGILLTEPNCFLPQDDIYNFAKLEAIICSS